MGEAQKFLTSQGVNSPAIAEKAGKATTVAEGAFNQAKPSLTSSLTSLSSRDPSTLAEYALGAVVIYYLVCVPTCSNVTNAQMGRQDIAALLVPQCQTSTTQDSANLAAAASAECCSSF